ncbi:hypothetical protein FDI40_gp405 [Agrobacterium phage Atu_ph07]|uniref:Uncharacterized protein n=1 Tax=Agrobacterium phage Atu_ph07 TaxID=2024264 RepID=A0A2L0V038_9CAUD|nr:hypothetical protein FDI40_gp405 [Agrobacterium phage Atu_ph07]AUZ95164.1 hypothetical protein [Agrobacterium phage Atu_ph07]
MNPLYLEYYHIREITSPPFQERARAVLLPKVTKDYVWAITEWVITDDSIVIDCTSKIFPTSKIINPTIDMLLLEFGTDTFTVWENGYDVPRKIPIIGNIIDCEIFV